ncbi:MAG: DUF2911 domain-containing protein [Gemmatimonadales bacterium]
MRGNAVWHDCVTLYTVRCTLCAAILLAGIGPDLHAQMIKWSQFGSVTQMLGDTEIEIRYHRPVARGRQIFGGIVKWGRVWTPGADSATTIEFSTDVMVGGHAVPAGKYSIWMIPRETGEWTVILSRAADVYHTPYPEGQDALRLSLAPEAGSHMETLALYLPVVDGPRAELVMHWGQILVRIPIQIELEQP